MLNELIPFKEDGERVTCIPSTAVVGKTFVSISGDKNANGCYTIAPAGANGKVFGVACWDAAIGAQVTVVTIPSGHIVPVTAGVANLAAGASVVSDANGKAVIAAGTAATVQHAVGIVLTGAVAGADAVIQLTRHSVTV